MFRLSLRRTVLLGAAVSALFCAGHASAAPFTYEVTNLTHTPIADPVYAVTDDLTFNNLLITETYTDGFMQSTALGSLNTGDAFLESPATLNALGHGSLASTVLTGQVGIDTFPTTSTLDISTQYTFDGPATTQSVFTNFSASLFGPATSGVSVGRFTLYDEGNNRSIVNGPVDIQLTPVPEATSAVSLGLLVLLGLGSLAVSRRRTASRVSAE